MNRLARPVCFAMEPDVVSLFARATFGAAGAPTLVQNDSKGFCQWAASSQVWTGTTTNSSTSVTGMKSLYGVYNGMSVTGTGIPASTTVTAVNPSAGTLTLSQAATGSATVALTFSGGQYILTLGSQLTPFTKLDTYPRLLDFDYFWDSITNAKLQTSSSPSAPAAPFVFLVANQIAFASQTFIATGTTATSTAVTALSSQNGIFPGMFVTGSGVAANTYVVAVSSTGLTLSAATSTSVANNVLTFTPNNPASIIIQCGYFTSTFTGSALGTHTHDLLIKGGQAASTTNDVAVYSGPILGKEAATDATILGANSATAGGVVAASAGTPSGTVGTPVFIAANPASGELLRIGMRLTRSTAI